MSCAAAVIALNTFRELIRGKMLYIVLFLAVALVLVSALFGSVSVGDSLLVVKDFGLSSISISCVVFVVITGASLLHKELERKTVFNILSKPVRRWEFVLGKFLGMYLTQLVFLTISSLVLCSFASLYDGNFDLGIVKATAFIALELLIVCASTLFFSSLVVTPILNGLFSLGFFLAGRSVEYILVLSSAEFVSATVSGGLKTVYFLLPHLSKLNISNDVVFGHAPDLTYFIWSAFYAITYAAVLMVLASILFIRREFN